MVTDLGVGCIGPLVQGLDAQDISCEEDPGARNATVLLLTVRFDYETTWPFSD
jgi:hypothetical protein